MKFILVSMFGTSIIISLTSFMKGGKTSNTEARKIKTRKTKTKNSDTKYSIYRKKGDT